MGISVAWDNAERTVLRVTYRRSWNWRDHRLACDLVRTFLDLVSHPVHLIFDLRESDPVIQPSHWPADQARLLLHPNWSGTAVFVGTDSGLADLLIHAIGTVEEPGEGQPFLSA